MIFFYFYDNTRKTRFYMIYQYYFKKLNFMWILHVLLQVHDHNGEQLWYSLLDFHNANLFVIQSKMSNLKLMIARKNPQA